ncbi:hypothetical protein E0493_21990 [Roseomonas sp. M0104]|uniref:Peptidase S8/S53 domain-containing protein n=1 Tax=Teichococcus coralli TaxID=2545983 RepID=A0A845BRL8_9PROT|nr:S8 family serine peptidase [Pseudoroseomonas coralli]MXP66019.1 hypothetical protein [Pseudoroseomonas coralli]
MRQRGKGLDTMDEGLSELGRELLGDVTDKAVAEAMGYREDAALDGGPAEEGAAPPPDWYDVISQTAYDFIVRWETGGRSYYEKVIRNRPVWPGYSSGVTIGCGYDLGYHEASAVRSDWEGRIGRAALERLEPTIGFRTVEPDRPAKVERAKALVASLSDVTVPWDVAIAQFDAGKLPKLVADLYRGLENLDRLHPHSRGALLSLVFNRGRSFAAQGPRYAEMRAIAEAMREGTPAAFGRIPRLLLDMRRIWGPTSSISERREGEAKLFEAGLSEMRLFGGLVAGATPEAAGGPLAEDHSDAGEPQSDVAEDEGTEEAAGLEPAGPAARAAWNPVDDEQPDYRHLDTRLAGGTAEITPEDIEALVAANSFAPKEGRIVFALRGARLAGGDAREDVPSFTITDQRPDHRDFRCVIGVYDPASRRLHAYQASTVPEAMYVEKCRRDFAAGVPVGSLTGNVLPTGCYTVTVGTHKAGQPGEIPAVLRLSDTPTGASRVVVLRSLDDATYDRRDRFVEAVPADNVHPGQRRSGFSSAGCLTLPGQFRHGQHSGSWAAFRKAAGFDESMLGKQFSLVLLTGLDAVMAAELRRTGGDRSALRRLRHGSRGEAVSRLQEALGLAPDASRLMGPVTRAALARAQSARLGWADAIHSPEMDGLLGFAVFNGTPEAAQPEAAQPALAAAAAADLRGDVPLAPFLDHPAGEPSGILPLRLVANFDGERPADADITALAEARIGRKVTVGPLFEADPDLDRFRKIEVPGVMRPSRADLFDLAAALKEAIGAAVVEPDVGSDYYAEEIPEDAIGQESADLAFWCWASDTKNRPRNPDWALVDTGVREAWSMQPQPGGAAQGKGVVIFQPDTGVVSAHVELPPGLVDDARALNLVESTARPEDPRSGGSNPGHGTATASIIVSPPDGQMSGAAPGATLVPVRCIETVAVFDQSPVAQAIDHARRNGAHVITMSLGGVPSMALHAALKRAVDENVIVLAAAGNCVGEVVWPARYDAAIAVAGFNEAGQPWRGSSRGPDVDISGPAEYVLRAYGGDTAVPPSAVSGGQGTSFATALNAAIAALWLAHHGRDRLIGMLPPGRVLQDVFRDLIRAAAVPMPGLNPGEFGPGLLRADRLLSWDLQGVIGARQEAPPGADDPVDSLVSLLSRTGGEAVLEAAETALRPDRQHVVEMACIALDRARKGTTRRAYLEAQPPPDMSVALLRRIGAAAAAFS